MTASVYLVPVPSPKRRETTPLSPLDTPEVTPKGRLLVCGVGAAGLHLAVAIVAGLLSAQARSEPLVAREIITEAVDIAPEPAPTPPPPVVAQAPVTHARPQAAAQVAHALTVETPAEQAIVDGDSATFAGGISQAGGTSDEAVRDIHARAEGIEGGTGTVVSQARAASLAGGSQWDCPFPDDALDVDNAIVTLRVGVAKDGHVARVAVVDDPGNGFGREAKRCALSKRWQPGLDDAGDPVASDALIKVRFER